MRIQLLFSILIGHSLAVLDDSCGVPNGYDLTLGNQCRGSIPHQFPWHIQLSSCGNYCGGSIISKNVFLKFIKSATLLLFQLTSIFWLLPLVSKIAITFLWSLVCEVQLRELKVILVILILDMTVQVIWMTLESWNWIPPLNLEVNSKRNPKINFWIQSPIYF